MDSQKLKALRLRLKKAVAAKLKADRIACNATARLSEAEERIAAIQAKINREEKGNAGNAVEDNSECGGSGPHAAGEVKVMPTGGNSNIILCRSCWERETEWRRDRNKAVHSPFDLLPWEKAKVYTGV